MNILDVHEENLEVDAQHRDVDAPYVDSTKFGGGLDGFGEVFGRGFLEGFCDLFGCIFFWGGVFGGSFKPFRGNVAYNNLYKQLMESKDIISFV